MSATPRDPKSPRGSVTLATRFPAVAAEWHPTKNGDKTPDQVSYGSGFQCWWMCPQGHEWESTPNRRTANKSGCPYCSGQRVQAGFNDLAATHPQIAAMWHPTRNGQVTPREISGGSNTKFWWVCPVGHDFECEPHRLSNGRGCGVCAGKAVVPGFNDLATVNPQLAEQWSGRNTPLTPAAVTASSHKTVWWTCGKGHDWRASPNGRKGGKQGCPVCANVTLLRGYNDLASVDPDLAAQWHPSNNGDTSPEDVLYVSTSKRWWVCDEGHEWEASPNRRRFYGCLVCSGRAIMLGVNDMASRAPEVAASWHPTKNGDNRPEGVTVRSAKKVWWVCSYGHEWQALVSDRTDGHGCPLCLHRVSAAERDLAEILVALGAGAVETQVRIKGSRKELDLVLPDHGVAVEMNGLYWHHDGFVDARAHLTKTELALEQGLQLVHIWEDDWRDRQQLVIRTLAAKLGLTGSLPRVLADIPVKCATRVETRSLRTIEADPSSAREFLTANHIEGPAGLARNFALVDDDGDIRALIGLRTGLQGGEWEIARYATVGIVPGGFTRLLAHAEMVLLREGTALRRWVAFAARDISDGDLYELAGFSAGSTIRPSYTYVGAKTSWRRAPRDAFGKARFRTDPALEWDEKWTEGVAARENGLFRVWDCGRVRYGREVTHVRAKAA